MFLILLLVTSFTVLTVSIASTCTQSNDKPTISLMVWDEIAREEGLKPAEFYIYRNGGDSLSDITVNFEVSGTAENGHDFNIRDHIILRGKEQTTGTRGWGIQPQTSLRIKPINDTLLEGDETVTIKLQPDADYHIDPGNSEGTIIIQDNEIPDVQFQLPSSKGLESSSGSIEVILSKSFSKDVKINYNISGALAQNFESSSGSLTIPAGKTEKTLFVDTQDNDLAEDDKTVIIEIINAENANIGLNNKHFYTILNDDGDVKRSLIYDKMLGVILGSRGGSSMGAVVEWCGQIEQVEKLYGVFHEFLPYNHYNIPFSHPAGATEDGIERQKFMCTAIIEKQDRIAAEDLIKIWKRDGNIEDMHNMTQPYDRILVAYLKWGADINDLPNHPKFGMPYDLGRHIHLTARVAHAIPIINAGDPEAAIKDTKEIMKLYYANKNDDAFAWGGVYNAAITLAMLPDATVNSVIENALKFASPEMKKEIEQGLEIADKYDGDPMNRGFREEINDMYTNPESPYYVNNRIERYRVSSIYENVTCAFAILKLTKGDVNLAVKVANNRARDADCTAASAGGLAGALTGTTTIPKEWIEYLDKGMVNTPYHNSHMPDESTAQALYRAFQSKLSKMAEDSSEFKNKKEYLELMKKIGVDF